MKVTFVGHASILVEAGGVAVLSDPWWNGPCFGAQWWTYPTPFVDALESRQIDYIYISHGHHDHLHPGTLATLPRTAKVLISSSLDDDLKTTVRDLGFAIVEVDPDRAAQLGREGLEVRIMPTHGDDTLMVLSDGKEVCVNLNDALHAAPETVQRDFIRRLRALYPSIDYVFCGYGVASHFPNCYVLPGKNAAATASRRQAYFNRQWTQVIAGLEPAFGFPFAADVAILQDELFWVNEATHNPERPTAVFRKMHAHARTKVIDIAPGFCIADREVLSLVTRQPIQAARLRDEMGAQIERANRVGRDNDAVIAEVASGLESNLAHCRDYLATFPGDYRIALRFIGSSTFLVLDKRGLDVSLRIAASGEDRNVDLTYTTRWAYMRWALQRPYGDELLFVGSGGVFEYADRDGAARAIHRELIALIRKQPLAKRPDAAGNRGLARAKRLIKRMLGRDDRDLYDLLGWTVFD